MYILCQMIPKLLGGDGQGMTRFRCIDMELWIWGKHWVLLHTPSKNLSQQILLPCCIEVFCSFVVCLFVCLWRQLLLHIAVDQSYEREEVSLTKSIWISGAPMCISHWVTQFCSPSTPMWNKTFLEFHWGVNEEVRHDNEKIQRI